MSASKLNVLPDDIISKLLLLLPVDDLLGCKSVCKSWLSIISDPSFVKSQLAIANAASDDRICIAHSYHSSDDSDTSFSLVGLDSCEDDADLDFPFAQDEFPYMPPDFLCLVGSACGIVCVSCSFGDISDIYLWNPATKMSKLIPGHNIHDDKGDEQRVVLGFGFDPIADDFKVVRVVSPSFSAQVYSANRNAWRNVEPSPNDFPADKIFDVDLAVFVENVDGWVKNFDVWVNGFLCSTGMYGMIAFDLNAEVFKCGIEFPVKFDGARITEYNDSIAALIWTTGDSTCKINLWSLDDEACLTAVEISPSWTLRQNIILGRGVTFVQGYFNGGDFLLKDERNSYLYNPDSAEADLGYRQRTDFRETFVCGQIFRYTKSLYKIAGFTQVNWIWNSEEDDSEDDSEDDN